MENLTHALYIAFAMVAFVIAFSVSLYLINKLNSTSETVVFNLDGSYYDSFSLGEIIENNEERNRSRIVGVDTIIPTLYRYYKESFAVKILDENGGLLQYFDTTTESDVNAAKLAANGTDEYYSSLDDTAKKAYNLQVNKRKALLSLYDDNTKNCYLFGAPWIGSIENNEDAKTRIDMYINGTKGYINKTYIDYSGNNLKTYKDRKFKEIFTQYAYEGDTITDENDELVTLTGSKQVSTKIIIIYQLLSS